ncbi:TPA: right-handed parallel beta-helix repeat-containing protein [Klebsiella pneumoniae]|nr:right-handed parallel beta-helix repeat-containing protein [Klebsiella pneumoniae]
MSVPNQIPYNIYTANGQTTVFTYEFYIISASDLEVSINGSVVTSGYTVSGVGNKDGGDITFLTPPANGAVVMLERVVPTFRLTDYQDNGDLLADTVNKDFDRIWMAIQRAFIDLGLALTRPLFGGPFNAKGYRIANLADPVDQQDAATKKYVLEIGNTNLARTLRVPESNVDVLPTINARKNSILGWNSSGKPVAIFSMTETADLALKLASNETELGASLIGLEFSGTVQDAIKFVTPFMFKHLVYDNDWSFAVAAADSRAKELGVPMLGFNQTFPVRSLSLTSDYIVGIRFVPVDGYTGSGPTFKVNQETGRLYLKISCKNFVGFGAKTVRGAYTGIPQLTLDTCEFNGNGSITRTTCVNPVNTATDFVIDVVSSAPFAVNDYVWIGDSKCRIFSISGNTVTLYNNGSSPTLYPGGTGTGSYSAGQFFTKDGNGRNGLTVGSADASWNIQTVGKNEFNNNGWFGLFCYSSSEAGKLSLKDADAKNNGYCGLGCGYVGEGEIVNNTTIGNGNNGIDIFQTSNKLKITKNRSFNNGVDGIFSGANGTGPVISENYCSNNKRIGILAFGRGSAPSGYNLIDNYCVGNELYSICLTGVYAAKVARNTMGAASQALKIEGRNGLLNPQGIIVSNNDFIDASVSRDIFANIGGYSSGGDSGSIKLLDNNFFGRIPTVTCTGFSTTKSKFSPRGRIAFTSSLTAAVGAPISVSLSFAKMSDTAVVDPTAGLVEMQFSNSSSFLATDTPTSATRTAGIEISNTATINGKILAMANAGALSYNVNSNTARTLYLMVKSDYGDGVISLTWS